MNSNNKRVMDTIPRDKMPVLFRGSLAPFILDPGPCLSASLLPYDTQNYCDFVDLGPHSSHLMHMLQFAVAHTVHLFRYEMEPEALVVLQRDLVIYAKIIWEEIATEDNAVEMFSSRLSEYCFQDIRRQRSPTFLRYLQNYEVSREDQRYNRSINRISDIKHRTLRLTVPCAGALRVAKALWTYASQVLDRLVYAAEGIEGVERARTYFIHELCRSQEDWRKGWIQTSTFLDTVSDIFNESSPSTALLPIQVEYEKEANAERKLRFIKSTERLCSVYVSQSCSQGRHPECPICLDKFKDGEYSTAGEKSCSMVVALSDDGTLAPVCGGYMPVSLTGRTFFRRLSGNVA
eukprot:IDg7857t1